MQHESSESWSSSLSNHPSQHQSRRDVLKRFGATGAAIVLATDAIAGQSDSITVDGQSSVYEDDGRTFDYRKGACMRMEMSWRDSDRTLGLRPASGSRRLPPAKRTLEVRVAGEQPRRTVAFDGSPTEIRV